MYGFWLPLWYFQTILSFLLWHIILYKGTKMSGS